MKIVSDITLFGGIAGFGGTSGNEAAVVPYNGTGSHFIWNPDAKQFVVGDYSYDQLANLLNGDSDVVIGGTNTFTSGLHDTNHIIGYGNSIAVPGGEATNNKIFGNANTLLASGGEVYGGIVLGNLNTATGNDAIIIGTSNTSVASGIVIGANSDVDGTNGVAIGNGASSVQGGVAIGPNAVSTIAQGIAIGSASSASAGNSIAIGVGSSAPQDSGVALGVNTLITDTRGVAIGYNANSGKNCVSIGNTVVSTEDDSVAVGNMITTSAINTIALGSYINIDKQHAISIGNESEVLKDYGIAIGKGTISRNYGEFARGTPVNAADGYHNRISRLELQSQCLVLAANPLNTYIPLALNGNLSGTTDITNLEFLEINNTTTMHIELLVVMKTSYTFNTLQTAYWKRTFMVSYHNTDAAGKIMTGITNNAVLVPDSTTFGVSVLPRIRVHVTKASTPDTTDFPYTDGAYTPARIKVLAAFTGAQFSSNVDVVAQMNVLRIVNTAL